MGLSFSHSVKFGAVRFNFSGSGIGMSVGVPGLRIGKGPRGAYISGGMEGFRYRKSLGAQNRAASNLGVGPQHVQSTQVAADPNIIDTVVHETKNVLALHDTTSDELLKSMNEQRTQAPLWPFFAAGFLILFVLTLISSETWLIAVRFIVFASGIGLTVWMYWRDKMRKLTVLFFQPDQTTNIRYESLCKAVTQAAAACKLKSIATSAHYADKKYTAGASEGYTFGAASMSLGNAPGVLANISAPILSAGSITLACYPDRILAFQGKAVGAINYSSLRSSSEKVRFIERETLPSDARVIDQTWKYLNNQGGPDKRFKDNIEIPVCVYNQFKLSTVDGLDICFLGSKDGGFDPLAAALAAMR